MATKRNALKVLMDYRRYLEQEQEIELKKNNSDLVTLNKEIGDMQETFKNSATHASTEKESDQLIARILYVQSHNNILLKKKGEKQKLYETRAIILDEHQKRYRERKVVENVHKKRVYIEEKMRQKRNNAELDEIGMLNWCYNNSCVAEEMRESPYG